MKTTLMIAQVVLSVLLSLVILVQQRGTGLSSTFGGGGTFYASKRGVEKFLASSTVVLAILFVSNSIGFIFVE